MTATFSATSPASRPRADAPLPGLLQTPDSRRLFRQSWKAYVARLAVTPWKSCKGPSARDMAVYALLLGKPLTKVFSPVSSPLKLASGQRPYWTAWEALQRLDSPARQMPLSQLLKFLNSEVVLVPSKKCGNGWQLGYSYGLHHQPLLDAARTVTEQQLEQAYAQQAGAQK